jgi:hypothetical protein
MSESGSPITTTATMSPPTICLYLCDMPAGLHNDKPNEDNIIYFQGIIECFDDAGYDKFSFFAELKKEEALFMKKTFYDIVEHNNGNYCKNHVLIDALLMYDTYVQLVDETTWGSNILESCIEFLTYIFRLFRLQSRIVVVVPKHLNEQDNLSALLKHLLDLSIIEIVNSGNH